MMTLHALWSDHSPAGLWLWGECSDSASGRTRRRSATRALSPAGARHPFAASHADLEQALVLSGLSELAELSPAGLMSVYLPSTPTPAAPLPSPELILDNRPAPGPEVQLLRWNVPALLLEPAQAADFLHALPAEAPPGLAFGGSLRFWVEAARFALELAMRQSFAPTVSKTAEGAYRAAWQIVLIGDDEGRAATLAAAMPPVCRALDTGGPLPSAQVGLSSFLNHIVDALARNALATSRWMAARRAATRSAPLDQWLQALAAPNADDAELKGVPKEIEAFAGQVRAWLDQLRPAAGGAPFRTCFRLSEPEDGRPDSPWQLSFHLQASDDRSLLVPAERVWREQSSTLTFLKRRFQNPQERLLEDLGRASRLFPLLESSLNEARPAGMALSVEQAYAFLRESSPLLEQAGFGVMLPAWWQKRSARLGVKLQLRPKQGARVSQNLLGRDAIVGYQWQLALGDQALSFEEFRALAALKVPLVNVRGQWVELQRNEIEQAIAFFEKKRGQGDMTLSEAMRIGLGQEQSETGLPVVDVEGEEWIGDLLNRLSDDSAPDARIPLIAPPAAFNGQLRPYQQRGLSWLVFLRRHGLGACLADDMGLGKTAQLIACLLTSRTEGDAVCGPALVVCPMSIVGNWQREFERFAPTLRVMTHHGAERLSGEAFEEQARRHDVVLTTYSLVHRDTEHLARVEWDTIVIDEAQNIKNPSAKQTQAIRRLSAAHRVALTGTPVENRLSELWSIMDFLNKGYLGPARDFHTRFALPIEKYRDADRSAALKRLIQPFVLRRLKTDPSIIADLPAKMEMKVLCNLTTEQATLYQAVVTDMLARIEESEGIERRGLVLATLMKLKQVCNHPAHFLGDGTALPGRSGKLARLEEMLEEALAAGDRALVFTQFAEMGDMLRRRLQDVFGREVLFLHGGVPRQQRDAMVQRFQSGHGPSIFVLSIKAGGVGLNLTAASHVFHFDRWWNPAVENQATDRAFRIGQTRNVQVRKFVCVGTLEERIDAMIEQKKELAERIVGAGENWLTEMSTAQLRDLFTLGREAVGE